MSSYLAGFFNKPLINSIYPKFFSCLKAGYSKETVFKDLFAGITIGILSLPLIMAFSIAAGLPPERGLYTGVVAGFLISFFGGSRVQIGGPTGAFVVVVYSIVERHGYEGLVIATIMAGCIMIGMALCNAGKLLKFIPYPVVTGFTTGIAISLFSSQLKDFFGLPIVKMPADFLEKWTLYIDHFSHSTWNLWALGVGIAALILIILLRKKYPKVPGSVVAVGLGSLIVYFFDIPVETIETKFGRIPNMLPSPSFPHMSFHHIQLLLPDAMTIAILSSVESLLSAVVADKITGTRHRSNAELFSQGIGNIFAPIFGGIPATGAIARTAANARMGATTPLAGMTHAITLFILMVFFATAAAKIPLTILAAVLIFVAWNMSEKEHVAMICKGPKSDIIMLFTTMAITVLIDITVAVEVGIVLGALLFMKKMSNNTHISRSKLLLEEEHAHYIKDSDTLMKKHIPDDVAIFEVNGPLFFGITESLNQQFLELQPKPRAFIFRLNKAPMIDTSGIHALQELAAKCKKHDISFLISGIKEDNMKLFQKMGLGKKHLCETIHDALTKVAEKSE